MVIVQDDLQNKQELVLHILVIVCSGLSVIGSTVIIVGSHSLKGQFPGLRIIRNQSIAELCAALTFIIGSVSPNLCVLQAFCIELFMFSAVLWTSCFAHSLYRHVCYRESTRSIGRFFRYYVAIAYGCPLLLAIIGASMGYFGDTGPWCWVTIKHEYMRIPLFYFWLFICFGYNFGTCMAISHRLRVDRVSDKNILHNLRMYIIVFLGCWGWAVANRAVAFVMEPPYWLTCMHAIGACILGFLFAIVWTISLPSLRDKLQAKILRKRAYSNHTYRDTRAQPLLDGKSDNLPINRPDRDSTDSPYLAESPYTGSGGSPFVAYDPYLESDDEDVTVEIRTPTAQANNNNNIKMSISLQEKTSTSSNNHNNDHSSNDI